MSMGKTAKIKIYAIKKNTSRLGSLQLGLTHMSYIWIILVWVFGLKQPVNLVTVKVI